MAVLAVLASFLAILVGIVVIFLAKFSDVMIVLQNIKVIIMLSSYMRDLEINTENLRAKKEKIDGRIIENETQSRGTISQVEVWKRDVEAIMPELQILVDYHKTRCRHQRGFSFICSNYLAAMECADKLEKVKDLLERGSFFDVVMVDSDSFIPTSASYEVGSSEPDYAETFHYVYIPMSTSCEVPGSLELNCAEALGYVQNDSSANIIGIWGRGGVGKTTLLSKIQNSCVELSIFDQVIWVDASRLITTQQVQTEIAQKLRLTVNGCGAALRAYKIFRSFLNKNTLLFIDDLRKAINLKEVGVLPNLLRKLSGGECHRKVKVVFTTRSKVVCNEMKAEKTIKVEVLNQEQSWFLFKEKVGERVILSGPCISKLAKDVAKECRGLPLALIVIGRAMSTKKSFHEWEYSLCLMRKSQTRDVPDVEDEKLRQILKISYDSLASEKLQQCFLTISMWPENFEISKSKLIECWMGLDIIDNFESMTDAYLMGFSLIGSLQAACLLEDVEKDENFNDGEEYVKMHHVLRDLALWIASNCEKNKDKWKKQRHKMDIPMDE